MGLHGALGVEQRDADGVVRKQPLIERLGLPLGVIRLEKGEVLPPEEVMLPAQFFELFIHKPALQVGQRFDRDHSQELISFADQDHVFVKLVPLPRQRAVEDLAHGRGASEDQRISDLREMRRAAAEKSKTETGAQHEAQLPTGTKSGHIAGADQGHEVDVALTKKPVNHVERGIVRDRPPVMHERFK